MEGPRTPLRDELPQILSFLNAKLRKDKAWTIDEEYPTAFSPNNAHNLCVITENDQILSHAVIKPLIIKTPIAVYKVAPIGSVITDEAHRNKGLSGQVLKQCLENALTQQCDLAILWTDLYDFYRKLGFELAGSEISYVLGRQGLPSQTPTNLRIVEGKNIDPQALLRVYTKHSVASIRTLDEIKKSLKIPNTRVYTAWGSDGSLAAYAIEGKGADLSGYIHEWGGMVNPLLNLFSHIIRTGGKDITVIVPEHSNKLRRALEPISKKEHHGYLGMIKILRPDVIADKANRAAMMLGLKGLEISFDSDTWTMKYGDESAQVTDEKEMVRLLFGPERPTDLFKQSGQLSTQLQKLFPLPLWIWGWDSI